MVKTSPNGSWVFPGRMKNGARDQYDMHQKGPEFMRLRIALLLALPLLMTACGGGSSGAGSSPGSISGNWQMSLQKNQSKLKPKTQSGFLVQNSDVVTGGLLYTSIPCSGVGSVSGSVTGASISLVVDPVGITLNLIGTVSSDQTSMSGNYTLLSSGCGSTESGAWKAELVKPLSGTFQGTFTSTRLGTALPVTGQISQGQNIGISNTTLSGNLNITGYCFASANISGVVSGTAVVINLVNPSGAEIAQVTGTSTLDGTSVTGTYHVIPQGPGGTPPCVDGDGGKVSLTL